MSVKTSFFMISVKKMFLEEKIKLKHSNIIIGLQSCSLHNKLSNLQYINTVLHESMFHCRLLQCCQTTPNLEHILIQV